MTDGPSEQQPGGFIRETDAKHAETKTRSPVPAKRPHDDVDSPSPAKRARKATEEESNAPDVASPPRSGWLGSDGDDSVAPATSLNGPDLAQRARSLSPPLRGSPNMSHGPSSSPPLGPARSSSPQSSPQSTGSASSFDSLSGASSKRVKLYRLNGEQWDDLGTGFCSVWAEPPPGEKVDEDEGPWLVVKAEEMEDAEGNPPSDDTKGEIIWKSGMRDVIFHGTQDADRGGYQKQQQTLIVWTEPSGEDMALSFASSTGCGDVWDYMEEIRRFFLTAGGSPLGTTPTHSPQRAAQPEAFLQLFANGSLPEPSLANLLDVHKLIQWASRTPLGREKLATLVIRNNFIRKLIPIMGEAEDLESLEDLHELCIIMQSILLLNENTIFECILQEDVIFGVTSILEYDPEFPNMKASYTAHLSDPSHFREVVPIKDASVKTKIHQIYRLQYLKDVVLARVLDDATFSMLNSFIYFHQVEIVAHLQQNVPFLSQLFGLFGVLMSNAPSSATPPQPASVEKQREGILFLQQFCSMAKNLQIGARNAFYRSISERGMLKVVEHALRHPPIAEDGGDEGKQDIRGAIVEILMTVVDHDPASVRTYSLRQAEEQQSSFMEFIIQLFLTEPDLGIKAQYAEAIRQLVQAQPEAGTIEAMQARGRPEDPDAEKFLQFFYDKCAANLVQPLLDLPDPAESADGELDLTKEQSALCAHLCDHLCYFVAAHSFRSKFFLLGSPVNAQVTRLMRTKQKHLRLSALRYLRACLGKNDEFWNRNLIKNDLFLPVLELAANEAGHENLITSACLDFFEFVRTHNTKLILNHLMEQHGDRLRALAENEATYKGLIVRWEQNNEPKPDKKAETSINGRVAEPDRLVPAGFGSYGSNQTKTLDAEEESYFEGSSDEDEPPPASQSPPLKAMSRKREAESESPRKRFKTSSGTTSASMVRSPAVIFQEMRIKGQLPSTGGLNSLADYKDDDEEEAKASESSSPEPAEVSVLEQAPDPPPLSDPPPQRKDDEDPDVLGMLGSGKKAPIEPLQTTKSPASAKGSGTGLKISFKPKQKGKH